jgi:hypothetical protein
VRGRHSGYRVEVEFTLRKLDSLPDALGRLAELGLEARPVPPIERDADGMPMCTRHGMAMALRERQGDQWHSHRIVTRDGRELYCRGRGGYDSPGWYVAPGELVDAGPGE